MFSTLGGGSDGCWKRARDEQVRQTVGPLERRAHDGRQELTVRYPRLGGQIIQRDRAALPRRQLQPVRDGALEARLEIHRQGGELLHDGVGRPSRLDLVSCVGATDRAVEMAAGGETAKKARPGVVSLPGRVRRAWYWFGQRGAYPSCSSSAVTSAGKRSSLVTENASN